RPSVRARRDRRHRHVRGEPDRRAGRPRDRRRHALVRLHDRVEDRVPESGRALRERERRRLRRAQARGAPPRPHDARDAHVARRGREVYVLVGDGSYLMLSSELVTAVAERQKLTIVLVDNRGYKSIGNLSRSLGMDGFGTLYRYRSNGSLGVDSEESTDYLPV